MRNIFKISIFGLLAAVVVGAISCRKNVSETEANSFVDKVSVSFGNDQTENRFRILNRGQKTLTWQLDENIDWLAAPVTSGQIGGGDSAFVVLAVDRSGLAQNQYSGIVTLNTNSKTHTIEVFLNVDMYQITVINPVFTPITIEVDTTFNKSGSELWKRQISAGDSTQFGYFQKPDLFVFYACTQGIYGDTTKLGLKMEWDEVFVPVNEETPRIYLNVPKEYFFLSVLNPFQTLNPLWVNAGTQYEKIENIIIYQSAFALSTGYYRALQNTLIRALVLGGTSQVTWVNGDQFEFPFSENQEITIQNYNNDSLKFSANGGFHYSISENARISHNYGDVIDFFAKPAKQ